MFTVIRTELDVYAPEVPDKMFHDINKIYKARRVAGRSGSSAAVQRNLDSLKKEADGNIKFPQWDMQNPTSGGD